LNSKRYEKKGNQDKGYNESDIVNDKSIIPERIRIPYTLYYLNNKKNEDKLEKMIIESDSSTNINSEQNAMSKGIFTLNKRENEKYIDIANNIKEPELNQDLKNILLKSIKRERDESSIYEIPKKFI